MERRGERVQEDCLELRVTEATLENPAGKESAVKREIMAREAFQDYLEPRERGDFQVQPELLANQVKKVAMAMQDFPANQD